MERRNPCLEVGIAAVGTHIFFEMLAHNLSARCLAGCNGCTRVGHFEVDAVPPMGRALSGRAEPFLCTADAPMPQNHVSSASDRTGDICNSSQDQGDRQQRRGRWQGAIECRKLRKHCRRVANVWLWARLDEAHGGRTEDRHSKCGRQSRWLPIQGNLNARTVCARNKKGSCDCERS